MGKVNNFSANNEDFYSICVHIVQILRRILARCFVGSFRRLVNWMATPRNLTRLLARCFVGSFRRLVIWVATPRNFSRNIWLLRNFTLPLTKLYYYAPTVTVAKSRV